MDGISDWLDSIVSAVRDTLDYLVEIASRLNPFSDKFFLKPVLDSLGTLLSYLNPLSDNFFLKKAFVPRDGYFTEKMEILKANLDSRLAVKDQVKSAWEAVADKVQYGDLWQGYKVTIPLIGREVTVVDPVFVNQFAPKMRFFIAGVMYLTLGLWVYRQLVLYLKD